MAKGFKSGGRVKGHSFNLNLRSSRNKMRRTFLRALPQLQKWLANDETWKADGAAAARAVMLLGEWSAPKFKPADSLAEGAAAASHESPQPDALPEVTAEQILQALKRRPRTAAPTLPQRQPAALPESAAQLSVLPARESESLRHAGIPQPDGSRVIPANKSATRVHHADPQMPVPAIDAEPDDPYWRSRQPAGCVSIHDSDAPISMPGRRYGR